MGRFLNVRAAVVAVAVAAGPLVLAPPALATHIYVSDKGANLIWPFTVLSGGTLVPDDCPSGCTGGGDPEGEAITPNGRFLYDVTEAFSGVVTPFAINSSGALEPIPCSSSACGAGEDPYWLAVTPNGKFMYVTNQNASTISQYGIGSGGIPAPIACTGTSGSNCDTGSFPEEPAITPNGRFLYVSNEASTDLSAFQIGSGGALTSIPCSHCATGTHPWTVAITPNGKFLYVVSNSFSGSVSVFAIASSGSLTPITCSACTSGLSEPDGMAISPSGKFLYVANQGGGTVAPYAINSNGSLKSIACSPSSNCSAGTPTSVTLSPNGKYLYATDIQNEVVDVFAVASSGTLSPLGCESCGPINLPEYGETIAGIPDQAPATALTITAAKAGHPSTLNGSGSKAAAGHSIATYTWTFGDGSRATTSKGTITHAYRKAGTYTVTLTVTDNAGCSTRVIFTGQTPYCNGGPTAVRSRKISVAKATAG